MVQQAEMTSCGLNGTPLAGRGEFPSYLACNLFTDKHSLYVGEEGAPRVMQEWKDGDEEIGYIGNITNGATSGFKYFDCKGVKRFSVTTRGYSKGKYELRTKWDGDVLALCHYWYMSNEDDSQTDFSHQPLINLEGEIPSYLLKSLQK